jgi:outer membrane protein assembly factor BamE (lipoprotein component of BamABCDE complex)
MSKLFYLFIIVFVCGLITSCATTYKIGKQFATEDVVQIVIGETSPSDIISFFGDPWRTGIFNGNIVYTYCYEEVVFNHDDSVDKKGNTLIIEFDQDKKVKNYYFNIPGNEPGLLTLMMHNQMKIEQEQEQVAWQNQADLDYP